MEANVHDTKLLEQPIKVLAHCATWLIEPTIFSLLKYRATTIIKQIGH